MKIIKNIIIWVLLIAYVIAAMSFVTEQRKKIVCNDIKVFVVDAKYNAFITQSDIKDLLNKPGNTVLGDPINIINTKEIEDVIQKNSSVKKAEVYVTINGDVRIDVDQRNPIVRVINKRKQSYYIDDEGTKMPLSRKYSSHVLIANGHIVEHFEVNKFNGFVCEKREENPNRNYIICDLFTLSKFIYNDDFWRSQIEQVYVNDANEFELIPRVGAHLILFGNIENYEIKFRNLKAFYEQGLNNVGWNKYEKINLKYENQIICTKR
ncbi:MAG: hypothetical protein A2X13_07185 [Bacteroidetes bacterium GWC2_33_15]|nr:MAG: hypothetical protein A2X10_11520 [Bacteroidetes bacterium GWA2_33_15]OFX51259.1 MAG: hypothetical protein A2X13_07185 [Bacteroidetes bacterium GWC2_33_15]OFX66369.1 MAG: hypothetical protein A2X15_00240 [Bacteroidetes bacterium GWB2_32_14]OFX70662.1 MAG: hypothetical protein A2X14_10925 [Bacteroidetes bacterium GWD2_33_33]HAN20053.1 hypothetical protein [Bacteroidales bacterium]